MKEPQHEIGRRIEALRKARGLTREAVEAGAGIGRGQMSRLMLTKHPREETVELLAKFFDVAVRDIDPSGAERPTPLIERDDDEARFERLISSEDPCETRRTAIILLRRVHPIEVLEALASERYSLTDVPTVADWSRRAAELRGILRKASFDDASKIEADPSDLEPRATDAAIQAMKKKGKRR